MYHQKQDQKKIKTSVENGALVITGENAKPLNIYITAEELNLIEINGSARMFARGTISSDILLLKLNGDGSMKLNVRTLTVGMIVKGNGKIIVSGSSGESFSRIYGNGNISAKSLDTFSHTEERIAFNDLKTNQKRPLLKLHQ